MKSVLVVLVMGLVLVLVLLELLVLVVVSEAVRVRSSLGDLVGKRALLSIKAGSGAGSNDDTGGTGGSRGSNSGTVVGSGAETGTGKDPGTGANSGGAVAREVGSGSGANTGTGTATGMTATGSGSLTPVAELRELWVGAELSRLGALAGRLVCSWSSTSWPRACNNEAAERRRALPCLWGASWSTWEAIVTVTQGE